MIAAIIQARMGSTRLRGKVMEEVAGTPLLKYQIDRVRKSRLLDRVIVATTDRPQDDEIASFCRDNKIDCFRGSENDVLDRYYQCAKQFKADIIVRLTADCPLTDPGIIDATLDLYNRERADYAANTVPPETQKYGSGLDVEIFSFAVLERARRECSNPHDREHVTFYFWKYNNGFKTAQLGSARDYSKYRVTVDYPEDLEVVKFLINELKNKRIFGSADQIADILDSNPAVMKKNSQYEFDSGWKQKK